MNASASDPYGVAEDPELPTLAAAIDPDSAQRQLGGQLPRLAGPGGVVHVRAIRVTRYKPARRCVLEYDVEVERPGDVPERVTLLGKVRRQRSGRSGYALLNSLWEAGFSASAADGIVVPEPVGVAPGLRMWLQRKAAGQVATELLPGPDGIVLARRVAEAAHKLHEAGVPSRRTHTMKDELRILHECLPTVARAMPRWRARIRRLLDASDRIGRATPAPTSRFVHRDFYGDQVIVDGERLVLIDFDQYCRGDPALDIGNFLGHITEYGLRVLGDPDALADVATALEDRFVELSGEARRPAVRAYAQLTLVRHVYVSTQIPDRRAITGELLTLCEERLALGGRYARA